MKTKTTKITGILLTLIMLVAMLGAFSLTASAADDIAVTIDTGASVTLTDSDNDGYYEIDTADKLYAFAAAVNGGNVNIDAVLISDITVNENVIVNGALASNTSAFRAWTPIGNDSQKYNGDFNGNNKKISGLYFKDTSISTVGLFGYNTGTVTGVGVEASYFSGDANVAGIVGVNTGTISLCYCSGSVISAQDTQCGGITGNNGATNSTAKIEKCYNTSTVSGKSFRVGGIAGVNSGDITDCYNTGTVTSFHTGNFSSTAGIAGGSYQGEISNCYNAGAVSGNAAGAIVGSLYSYGTVTNCYNNSDVSSLALCRQKIGTTIVIASSESVTTDLFKSGKIAYLLNANRSPAVWGQTVDADAAPVLDVTESNVIYKNGLCSDVKYENTSGTFSHDAAIASENYNEDGICRLCGAQAAAKLTTADATPVVTHHMTLEEAITAASAANGSTITLLTDCAPLAETSEDWFVISSGEFTINLNGKKLLDSSLGVSLVINSGTITLMDENTDPGGATDIIRVDGGTLTIKGGNYEDLVCVRGGVLIIESGSFVKASKENGTLTVKGGSFETLSATIGGGTLANILPADYYIYGSDGKIINAGAVEASSGEYTVENVTVKYGAVITADMITVNNVSYNGEQQLPTVTVTVGGVVLEAGKDYKINTSSDASYGVNIGEYSFSVSMDVSPAYTGEAIPMTYTIGKGSLKVTEAPTATHEFGDTHADKTITGGKVVIDGNDSVEITGTWTWVDGTTTATFTPDAQYDGLFETLATAYDVTINVTAVVPALTLETPSPSIMPGMNIQMGVTAVNPNNSELTDLPTDFKITYRVGENGTETTTDGLKFTLPSDTTIGEIVHVWITSEAVDGKYTASQSNVIDLTVGQVDYSQQITALEEDVKKLNNLIAEGGDIDQIKAKITEITNRVKVLEDNGVTDEELDKAKSDLTKAYTEAYTEALNKAVANLEDKIAAQIDPEELEAAIKNVTDIIDALDNTYATDKQLTEAMEKAETGLITAQKKLESKRKDCIAEVKEK